MYLFTDPEGRLQACNGRTFCTQYLRGLSTITQELNLSAAKKAEALKEIQNTRNKNFAELRDRVQRIKKSVKGSLVLSTHQT